MFAASKHSVEFRDRVRTRNKTGLAGIQEKQFEKKPTEILEPDFFRNNRYLGNNERFRKPAGIFYFFRRTQFFVSKSYVSGKWRVRGRLQSSNC